MKENDPLTLALKTGLLDAIKNGRETVVDLLNGKTWVCRAEQQDGECLTQAPSCCDCLSVPKNFEDLVIIL